MADDGLRALEKELGRSVPRGVRSLDGFAVNDLASAIREAKRRQARDLATAGEAALDHIPRLLRPPIRRMFS
ncbi:MAG: hypothetical protein JOZ73_10650 [Solirubrobacterales bacterium]|nr:hypothetical protein [Solirubrobacterales bacterium]